MTENGPGEEKRKKNNRHYTKGRIFLASGVITSVREKEKLMSKVLNRESEIIKVGKRQHVKDICTVGVATNWRKEKRNNLEEFQEKKNLFYLTTKKTVLNGWKKFTISGNPEAKKSGVRRRRPNE